MIKKIFVALPLLLAHLPLAGPPGAHAATTPIPPGEAVLVADFAPGSVPVGMGPATFASEGDKIYFSGFDARHGREPWVSDGTAAGTRLLADLCPGTCSSEPTRYFQLGDRVVISTRATAALYAVSASGAIERLAGNLDSPFYAQLGNLLYFLPLNQPDQLGQFFVTDGSRAGTRPATELCVAPECRLDTFPLEAGDSLYFNAAGTLYRMTPAAAPQALRPLTGALSRFTALPGDRFLFRRCTVSCEAWVTDGTGDGTLPLGSTMSYIEGRLASWRDRIYFLNEAGAAVSTDGTVAGTRLEPAIVGNDKQLLGATGSHLYYLSSSPGAAEDLRAIDAGGGSHYILQATGHVFAVGSARDILYFSHDGSLTLSAGSAASTLTLGSFARLVPGTRLGDRLFFGVYSGNTSNGSGHLWQADGIAAPVKLEVGLEEERSSEPTPYRVGQSLIAKLANPPSQTPDFQVFDPQGLASTATFLTRSAVIAAGHDLLYLRTADYEGSVLTALTATGLVPEFALPGATQSGLADDDHLFFSELSSGEELWETDGSQAGTRELFDTRPGCDDCLDSPRSILPRGDQVFFLARGISGGEALYAVRRGETSPSRLLTVPSSFPTELFAAPEGRVGFVVQDNETGAQSLWLSDGTVAGTRQVAILESAFELNQTAVVGSKLFFTAAWIYPSRARLYVHDVASNLTQPLTSGLDRSFGELVAAGDRVYFSVEPALEIGPELGSSRGTPSATLVLDLNPGPDGSFPRHLYPLADGRVVFAAATPGHGSEPWISDGSLAGSRQLAEVVSGADSSSPSHFAAVGDRLFFQADQTGIGRELWAVDLDACPVDRLCLLDGRFEVEIAATTAQGGTFPGRRQTGNSDSGIFSFFSEDNWEMLVKVLDGCAINGKRWVFAAGTTDVGWTLTVRDRNSGAEKVYRNPLGQPSATITDTAAFSCN